MNKKWKRVVKAMIKNRTKDEIQSDCEMQAKKPTSDGMVLEDLLKNVTFKLWQSWKGLGQKHSKVKEKQMQKPRISLVC